MRIDRARLAPIVALAASSILFTELLSGNIPFPLIAHPLVLALLAVAYAGPVLLIREAAARWSLGAGGVLLLGLAYGVYNEGLVARTLLQESGPPLFPSFHGYGFRAGISVPWLLTVVPWHAVNAALYPIALVSAFWPERSREPWLSGRQAAVLAALSGGLGVLAFFKPPRPPGAPAYFALFAAAIAALAALARLLREAAPGERPPEAAAWRPFLWGAGTVFYFAGVQWVAAARAPLLVFIAAAAAGLACGARLIARVERRSTRALALFGLGAWFVGALIRMGSPGTSPLAGEPTAVGALFLLASLALARRLSRI